MGAGEVILVAYGEENTVLSENSQITFFKIIYRRYTNFSIETVQVDFLYDAQFGEKYTVEITKVGDLLNKMWLVIELPEIPIIYNFSNEIDNKIKFKWTRKLAYAIIDYVEIEIGNQTISRQWGEWMNVMEELNWNNFNSSLDEYIGNIPSLTQYQHLNKNFQSKILYIPMWFWFCNSSGASLPLLCLEYNTIRFNIQFNNFQQCGIFSPSNYIEIDSYYGTGILGEPLIQYSNQGIAWGEFDSIDIGTFDNSNMNVKNYLLYYRKISDNQFVTTSNFISNYLALLNKTGNTALNYIIIGLYSGSIFVPSRSNPLNPTSIYIQKTYTFNMPTNLVFKKIHLLCDFIYLDREERKKFYTNKHEYTIEQIYYSNPIYSINMNNKFFIESINPCKYVIFMAQVRYFMNFNVNENFNYNTYFFDPKKSIQTSGITKISNINNPVIKTMYFSLNTSSSGENFDMKMYANLIPFFDYQMGKNSSGFGINDFSLYPTTLQPSGSINLSSFSSFQANTSFYPLDINYNNYIFKCYTSNYNFLKIVNGVAATIFNSPY